MRNDSVVLCQCPMVVRISLGRCFKCWHDNHEWANHDSGPPWWRLHFMSLALSVRSSCKMPIRLTCWRKHWRNLSTSKQESIAAIIFAWITSHCTATFPQSLSCHQLLLQETDFPLFSSLVGPINSLFIELLTEAFKPSSSWRDCFSDKLGVTN